MSLLEQKPEVWRCAIYTRKSVQQGLEREFNSLEAQRVFPDARLVSLIKRARTAQSLLEENRCEETSILAKRVRCGPTRFARLVRLNYLAPDIIASILDGTQPGDLTRRRLMESDIPMDWSLQRRMLGFPDQPDYLKSLPGY